MKNFMDYTSRKCFASARVASPRLCNITHTRKISFSGLVIQITINGAGHGQCQRVAPSGGTPSYHWSAHTTRALWKISS
jgi:hypothetical protein